MPDLCFMTASLPYHQPPCVMKRRNGKLSSLWHVGYGGMCPSRLLGSHASIKIIDSLSGSAQRFESTIQDFDNVVNMVLDPEWVPRNSSSFVTQLAGVRAYFSHVREGATTEPPAMILTSTIQKGLECIIISMVRAGGLPIS